MVTEQRLRRWLHDARRGRRPAAALLDDLARLPFENLGFARLDTHRALRRGHPEVVLCEGKTPAHLLAIAQRVAHGRGPVLLTRLDPALAPALLRRIPHLRYVPLARIAYRRARHSPRLAGLVAVVSGGTSDLAVAEEAAVTAAALGSRVARLYDVGVAGVHRLLHEWKTLRAARVVIVVAGMEGALASVVAGLIRAPVIAVPTSVGYGASFQGIAPLLAMMNSCVPGVAVVNIDNGFGAGYLAQVINRPPRR